MLEILLVYDTHLSPASAPLWSPQGWWPQISNRSMTMAVGNIVLEWVVPELPTGATETKAEYFTKVREVVAAYFTTMGLDTARLAWVRRYDIPESESTTVAYLEGLIAGTNIDLTTSRIEQLIPPNNSTLYCVLGDIVDCYSTYRVVSRTVPNDPTLVATVTLNGGLSAEVEIRFVVTFGQEFPG